MAATVTCSYDTRATLTDEELRLTQPATTPTIAVSGSKLDVVMRLAPGGVGTLWQASTSQVGTFKYLGAFATEDCLLELTTTSASAQAQLMVLPLANGVPFQLGSNASRYDLSAGDGFNTGIDGTIDRVRVQNLSASAELTIRLVLLT